MDILAWDHAGLTALNQFVGAAPAFDSFVMSLTRNYLLKGGVIMGLLWWCWTSPGGRLDFLAARTIAGALLAVGIGRAMQNFLPSRPRPLHDHDLAVLLPAQMDPTTLTGWSSFPSDNAALFFALSTAAWAYSRYAGIFAFVWSLIVVCLPRIYLGLHYPSDIAGGALLGIGVMAIALRVDVPESLRDLFYRVQRDHPKLFFAAGFLVTFEIATLFEGSRRVLHELAKAMLA